ncbi:MAG: glycosyltransferase family 4 protein [Promethearchaeota archaeon]
MLKQVNVFMFLHGYYYKDVRVKKEAISLAKNGFIVTVLCLREKTELYSHYPDKYGIRVIPVRKMKEDTRKTPLGMLLFWISLLQLTWKMKDITIVHAHDLPSVPPGIMLKFFHKTKFLIFDAHEQFSDAVYDYFGSLAFGITQLIENLCTKQSDLLIGVMKPQLTLVRKRIRTPKNLSFCYLPNYPVLNGFLKNPRFHDRNDVFKVIFLGSMQPERCYDQLIEAAKILQERSYPSEIKIIGDGPMYSHILDRVKNENLENIISMTGQLEQEKALEITYEGDAGLILVAPQRNMRSIMPNKFFEYLQLGLGVISVKANGIGSYIKRINGIFIENPMNPESIAQAIIHLQEDETRRKKMVLKAQKLIKEKWNWSTCEKRLVDSYKKLLISK